MSLLTSLGFALWCCETLPFKSTRPLPVSQQVLTWLIQRPIRSVEEAALTNSCCFQDLVFHVAVEDADLPWAVTNGISDAVRRGVLLSGRTALAGPR